MAHCSLLIQACTARVSPDERLAFVLYSVLCVCLTYDLTENLETANRPKGMGLHVLMSNSAG
jgi:hypothetical protein